MDQRLVPGETQEHIRLELDTIFAPLRAKHPHLMVTIEPFGPTRGGPSETDVVHALVTDALRTGSRGRRKRSRPCGFTLNSDMTIFREHGVPTIILGPGDPKIAHQPDEFVPADELVAAARIYAGRMRESPGLVP